MVVRPEKLIALHSTMEEPESPKDGLMSTQLHLAAKELHGNLVTNLPRASFEAVPNNGGVIVEKFPNSIQSHQDHPFSKYRLILDAINTNQVIKVHDVTSQKAEKFFRRTQLLPWSPVNTVRKTKSGT